MKGNEDVQGLASIGKANGDNSGGTCYEAVPLSYWREVILSIIYPIYTVLW